MNEIEYAAELQRIADIYGVDSFSCVTDKQVDIYLRIATVRRLEDITNLLSGDATL